MHAHPPDPTPHRGSGTTFETSAAFILQSCQTEAEYRAQLARIRATCPLAAEYFDSLDHNRVYQYKFNEARVANHGFKTSQIVESNNGTFLDARHEHPYRTNNSIAKWIGKELESRPKVMQKWIDQGHILTPYARAQ